MKATSFFLRRLRVGSRAVGDRTATVGRRGLAHTALLCGLGLLALACSGEESPRQQTGSSGISDVIARESAASEAPRLLLDVLQDPDMLERVRRVAAHLQSTPPEELETTRKVFETASLDRGDLEYTLFAEWWARFDPEAAFVWANFNLTTRHPRAIAAVVRAWARIDPEAARANKMFYRVDSMNPGYRAELLDALVVGWFESGKPGLMGFLASLVEPTDAIRGLQTYARLRVIRDGDLATLEWARDAPEFTREQHRLLLAGALTVVAMQNPMLAAEWVPILEADGVDTRTFLVRIVIGWCEFDPKAAVEWLGTLPFSHERTGAIVQAAGFWVRKDERQALSWLDEREDEEWVDPIRVLSLRRAVQSNHYHVDWNELVAMADRIIEPDRRTGMIVWVAQRWRIFDEQAADTFLASRTDLSENQQIKASKVSASLRNQAEAAYAKGEAARGS